MLIFNYIRLVELPTFNSKSIYCREGSGCFLVCTTLIYSFNNIYKGKRF